MIKPSRPLLGSLLLLLSLVAPALATQGYALKENIPYYAQEARDADAYISERCMLDLYSPEGSEGFPTIVWFHGGGLEGGNKWIPNALKEQGVAVVAVNYRLHPKAEAAQAIDDATAAVAWVVNHIGEQGGDPSAVFVSGHSAGGYLAMMSVLDKSRLAAHGIDADSIAGLIPFSGHTITHMTVRKERGIPGEQAVVDELAPLYHVRPDAPPLLLITGDRNLELLGRYEENAYMWRMMKVAGHTDTHILELQGYDHGGMAEPAFPLLLKEVHRVLEAREATGVEPATVGQ